MRLSVLCFLLCCSSLLCAEDWTLGASAFSVESRSASSAEQKAAVDLPRLLLEKIGKDAEHILSGQELLEHELYELQTKRLSLFLQLSREIRLRDSLVLSEKKPNKLKKKLAAEEEKILEIEEKIKANLAEAEQKKAGVPETAESHSSLTQSIVLYQGDEMSLYEEAEEIIRTQDIVSKKINGLISGSLVTYGDYAAVTAELTLYPGATPAGTVTEVGALADITYIADNLAYGLLPLIVNTIPVNLYFDIVPEDAAAGAKIFIDDVLQSTEGGAVQTSYGLHTVEIESDGFFPQKITYNFKDSADYQIRIPLEKMNDGTFTVTFADAPSGSAYANASLLGYIEESSDTTIVTINGRSVVGQFVSAAKDGKTQDFFYYIPPDMQKQGAALGMNVKLKDTDAVINERRIWMYRGYSAFMLSLPLAVLSYGKYLTTRNGYKLGAEGSDALDNWTRITQLTAGMAIVSGGFFIIELVRYLHSASSVLPQEPYMLYTNMNTDINNTERGE